jgi:hypothetical protein
VLQRKGKKGEKGEIKLNNQYVINAEKWREKKREMVDEGRQKK